MTAATAIPAPVTPIAMKLIMFCCICCFSQRSMAQLKHSAASAHASYNGLVMAGYQGWFNAAGDGAGRGWNHYRAKGELQPGNCKFDLWPETAEYTKTYATPFKHADSSAAVLFSSYDASTTDLHFKWMQQYSVDGVFMQRFLSDIRNAPGRQHNNTVLAHALAAARKYGRAITVMYDLTGMRDSIDADLLIRDWKNLVDSLHVTTGGKQQPWLYHNGKPLVAVWGVGFSDKRSYTLHTVERIMNFLQYDPQYGGCALLLGVPARWRELEGDATSDTLLHTFIKRAAIVQPWNVGRYTENNLDLQQQRIVADLDWCKRNGVDYVPVVYPGFSWHNMYPGYPSNQVPRNKGMFYWKQVYNAVHAGAQMLYVAMFDEIDEGTAIFKISGNPPVGASPFVRLEEGVPADYYLRLTGKAGAAIRKEIPLTQTPPVLLK